MTGARRPTSAHVDDDDLIRRRPRHIRVGAIGIVVALLAGVSGGIWRACTDDDAATAERPLEVESSGPDLSSLEELVAASAVVVIGRAVSVTPGRSFAAASDGGGSVTGIRSQIVELEVGAVLAGADPGATVALEEEAATSSGRPLVVDGLRPTQPGDQGIFFLVPSRDPDVPYFATVSTSGRFLRTSADPGDDGLESVDGPLARQLAELGGSRLADRVLAIAAGGG